MAAILKYGTCSWKYPSWHNLVYSQPKNINYLQEYAQHYESVEIDQWFWSLFGVDKLNLPRPNVVAEYVESVPKDFKFTIKAPNSLTLTHFYRKNKNESLKENPYFFSRKLLGEFLHLIEPMWPQIGGLMFQFEYLNKQKMPSQYEFHNRVATFVAEREIDFPFLVETRNPWYLRSSYFDFLNKNNLGHVFLQGYYMPSIIEVYEKYRNQIQGTTIIRLHGGDRKEIEEKSGEQWNQIWEDHSAELRAVADMIKDLQSRQVTVYVNVNNHYEGSAPLTIDRIKKLLDPNDKS